jgi:thioesterase domain-containing protein
MKAFIGNLPYWLGGYLSLGHDKMLKRIRRKARTIFKDKIPAGDPRESRMVLEDVLDDVSHIPEKYRELMQIHIRAMQNYSPPCFPGRATLFRVRGQSLFGHHSPDNGWGKLVSGGVDIIVVPGAHHNLFEKRYVRQLAAQLNSSLAQKQK